MKDYREERDRVAADYGLDPLLVEAVIQQESAGKPAAFRHEPGFYLRYLKKDRKWDGWDPRRIASSYGLMQVMYTTALDHGFVGDPEELFKISVNLDVGCRVLAGLVKRFKGDLTLALAAYNGGPGNVHAKQPLAYARNVLLRHAVLREANRSVGDRPGHA